MGGGDLRSGPQNRLLDPRTVYDEGGEDRLREELASLDRDALETVVRKHPPHHTPPPAPHEMSRDELIGYIVDGVKRQEDE